MRKELFSERLKLKAVELSDLDFMFSLLRNSAVKKYLLDDTDIEKKTVEGFIIESNSLFVNKNIGLWIAQLKSNSKYIGLCGFLNNEVLELIYIIHPDFENNGYATESCAILIEYFLKLKPDNALYAKIDIPNTSSHFVAKKIGMVEIKEEINENTGGVMKVYKL